MKTIIAALAVCCLCATLANAQAPGSENWIEGGITDGGISITNVHSEDVGMLGLDVSSSTGGLKASGAGPFTITLLDTPINVVTGNLGNEFVLAAGASVTTEIGFTGEAFDLSGTWGQGVVPTAITFVPEPATGLMACFAVLGILGFRRRH